MFIFNKDKTSLLNTEYVQSFFIFESNDDGEDDQMNHKFVKVVAVIPPLSQDRGPMRETIAEFNTRQEAIEWLSKLVKKETKKK